MHLFCFSRNSTTYINSVLVSHREPFRRLAHRSRCKSAKQEIIADRKITIG